MGSFVRAAFPDALRTEDFCARVDAAAHGAGYQPGATLLVTGSCRDELCFPFGDLLQRTWGSAFHIGSLGGLLFLGRTGMAAAAQHAPRGHRRRRYLVLVALTHVGFGADGTPGRVGRPHQDEESSACGALVALRDEIAQGVELAEVDPGDWSRGCCAVVSRTCGPPAPTSASSTSRSRRATRSVRTLLDCVGCWTREARPTS